MGSDSVASNNVCDILEEARFATLFARSASGDDPTVDAGAALFAATLGGARALNLDHQIGSLAAGKQADIAIIKLNGAHQTPATSPVDTIIFSTSGRDVILTMVAGCEIYRDGIVQTVSENDLQRRLREVRTRIEGE